MLSHWENVFDINLATLRALIFLCERKRNLTMPALNSTLNLRSNGSCSKKSVIVPIHLSPLVLYLEVKKFFHFPHSIVWIFDTVANSSAVLEDLIIISSFGCLIAKEVDSRIFNTTKRLLCLQVLQAVSFIPACREYIKGNLSADCKAGTYISAAVNGLLDLRT